MGVIGKTFLAYRRKGENETQLALLSLAFLRSTATRNRLSQSDSIVLRGFELGVNTC